VTALVGPLPTIQFQDGTRLVYTPPGNTCDPRARVCAEHRVACDCREAEWAEMRTEWRLSAAEHRQTEQALEAVGKLHRSYQPPYGGRICYECHKEWPCPTWKLAADASWLLALMERQGEA
jgi:hypothetical protein